MFSDCCAIYQTPASGFGLKSADQALRAPHARPLSSLEISYSIAREIPAVLSLAGCGRRGTSFFLAAIWSNLPGFTRYRGTRRSISAMRAGPEGTRSATATQTKDHDGT